MTRRLGVLISGRGSNLQAILAAIRRGDLDAVVAVVVSNKADAAGPVHAREAGIATEVLDHRAFRARAEYDAALVERLRHHDVGLVLIFVHFEILYTPFLVLSIVATVIASQARISGIFSIVYQGITTHTMPVFKVDYTSAELRSQIYVGFVNWFLLVAVLVVMVEFREASRLAAAYGLAVTGTMTLTGIMMTWIFYLRGRMFYAAVSVFVTVVDIVFLLSNSYKIPHGGYWSIIIASIPLQ